LGVLGGQAIGSRHGGKPKGGTRAKGKVHGGGGGDKPHKPKEAKASGQKRSHWGVQDLEATWPLKEALRCGLAPARQPQWGLAERCGRRMEEVDIVLCL
jgi:hypothetical protein